MILTLLASLALQSAPAAPAATPAPTAPPAAPTRIGKGGHVLPASSGAAAPAPVPQEEPSPIPPELVVGPPIPRAAWIFIDRWKEFGGWVISDSDTDIALYDGYETRTFGKGQVLEIVELVRPKPGQQGIVLLRDGSRVQGVILEDNLEGVRFQADKVVGHLPRHQVFKVVLQADFNERYRLRKALATREEHGRRLALGQWLVDEGRMDLAEMELEELVRESDMQEARDLLRSVRAQRQLAESAAAARRAREEKAAQDAANRAGSQGAPATQPAAPTEPAPSPVATAPTTAPSATPSAQPTTAPVAPPSVAPPPAAPPPDQPDNPTPNEPAPQPGSTSLGPPNPRDLLPKDLLSPGDVNLIRVYEMDFSDPPAIRIQPEGVRQLILRYGSSSLLPATTQERNELYGKPPLQIARLMFDLKARDLYSYIEVQEDPPSLARFRTRVHNSWMIPNCATSRCHGGVQAGEFFLYTGNATDARVRYTNLMTLLNYQVDGKPMVNFEAPADSLLIQYAMPRQMARFPHPDVKGWAPVFKSGTPQLLNDTVEWIRGMYQPRPEYPVQYKPPKLDAPDKPVRPLDGPDR